MKSRFSIGMLGLTLAGCGGQNQDEYHDSGAANEAERPFETVLLEQLIEAEPGDVIEIPEGRFSFNQSLSLMADGVTIRGAGHDKSILSFKDQVAGAEGILVTASDFTIEDIAIEDTTGDGLKVNGGENIVIRGLRVEWTNGPATENGAYGLYPVQTENILIEDNIAIGASDAGIYVGQSQNIIVRNNRVEYNVAGIEVENSIDADIYGNVATNNTGGILVFNMPNLPQQGYAARVFDNDIYANNTQNFGHEGSAVAGIPTGTGVLINSNDQIEIFDNRIADNDTANVIISSLYTAGYVDKAVQDSFDAYPEAIWIYQNEFSGGGARPDGEAFEAMRVGLFGPEGRLPDIFFDGYVDESKFVDGEWAADQRICVSDEGVDVLNIDAPNGFASPRVESELYRCTLKALPQVTLAFQN